MRRGRGDGRAVQTDHEFKVRRHVRREGGSAFSVNRALIIFDVARASIKL